jgi:hypothetical protein
MTDIKIHTFPEGQQLSEGEIVQIRKRKSGRWVFRDCYFADLQDGDEYIIPEQVELPLASDTEIIDFLLKNQSEIGWTIFDRSDKETSSVYSFSKDDLNQINERLFPTGDTPRLLGAFREMMTDLINEKTL